MSIFRKSIIFVHYLAKNVIYINFMMNILDERSISVLHGIWNQNQLHKHLEEKIYKCVISSLYNIIRLFFTPNQDNHFTRRFIYVLYGYIAIKKCACLSFQLKSCVKNNCRLYCWAVVKEGSQVIYTQTNNFYIVWLSKSSSNTKLMMTNIFKYHYKWGYFISSKLKLWQNTFKPHFLEHSWIFQLWMQL